MKGKQRELWQAQLQEAKSQCNPFAIAYCEARLKVLENPEQHPVIFRVFWQEGEVKESRDIAGLTKVHTFCEELERRGVIEYQVVTIGS
jgi:hypothetical protein